MSLASQVAALSTRIANTLRDSYKPRLLPAGGTLGQALIKTGAADFAAGWAPPGTHPGYVAGRRYNGVIGNPNNLVVPGATISGVPAQRIWLYPDYVPQSAQFDQLGVYLYDNPDSNSTFILATYGMDPISKLPTGLPILKGANPGPTSVAGIPVNVDFAAPALLSAGWCWRAFMTNSVTARFEGISPIVACMTSIVGMINGGSPGAQSGSYAALAIGAAYGAWPDLTGTTEASYIAVAGPYAPAVWARPASVG